MNFRAAILNEVVDLMTQNLLPILETFSRLLNF